MRNRPTTLNCISFDYRFHKVIEILKDEILTIYENIDNKEDKQLYIKQSISEINEVKLHISKLSGSYNDKIKKTKDAHLNEVIDFFKNNKIDNRELIVKQDIDINASNEKNVVLSDKIFLNEVLLLLKSLDENEFYKLDTMRYVILINTLKTEILEKTLNKNKNKYVVDIIDQNGVTYFKTYVNNNLTQEGNAKNYQVYQPEPSIEELQGNNLNIDVERFSNWLQKYIGNGIFEITPFNTPDNNLEFPYYRKISTEEDYIDYIHFLNEARRHFFDLYIVFRKIENWEKNHINQVINKLNIKPMADKGPKFKPEALTKIFDILKLYFPSQHAELKSVLETGNIPSSKLLFYGNGVTLLDFFQQLLRGQLVAITTKTDFESWISEGFEYLYRKNRKNISLKYASKIISGYERAAEGKRLIEVKKNNVGEFEIIQLEIQNRKKA